MNPAARCIAVAAGFALVPAAALAQNTAPEKPMALDEAKELFAKAHGKDAQDWSQYFVDSAGGSINAFSMLGVGSDSVVNVQNVRDLTVAVKGFGSHSTGFGVSVTPARTSFMPMDLSAYASSSFDRVLGSTTLGYAYGTATIGGADYSRQAVSIESNYFFHREDDPVLAVAYAYRRPECRPLGAAKPGPAKPAPNPKPTPGSQQMDEDTSPEAEEAKARAAKCRDQTLKNMRWNRSQVSASFATGWIRPEAGNRGQESLGRSFALGLTYGFDGSPSLQKSAAAYLTLRRTTNEPILDTLALPAVDRKSSSLAVMRIAGGSKTFRGLAEISNADSRQVTESQRAFKQGVGVDYRIMDGTWLSFRFGKQRTVDGSRNEVTSMVSLSYSPGPKSQ
jgi:hypothetical protein